MQTKSLFTLLLVFALANLSFSQGFVDPYPYPTLGDGARVVLKNGDEIKGKWFGMTGTPKNLKNIQIKDENKERQKYLTPDVDRVYITLSGLMKWSKLGEVSTVTETRGFIVKKEVVNTKSSIVNMVKNWDAVMNDNTEIAFDMVSEEDGKYGMRQLLNPGFDSKYRIYQWGQGAVVMGKQRYEYMLISPSGETTIVTNKTYQESFPKLFGDCTEFMESFDASQVAIEDIAFHIFLYTDMCKE